MMRSRALCLSVGILWCVSRAVSEYSSKADLEYEFGDYRGKWCIDDHGFVYGIGEVYYPSRTACPCTCTEDGPICIRPKCPRIHPRCTRIKYKSCCPVCEAVSKVCIYGGKTYRPLEEFKLSPCERCRCEPNREVYCTISGCPALHCVDPTFEPNHCCPVCKYGANCFAGNRVIPAGERVDIDERTVCFCTYRDGTWQTHPHASCETRQNSDNELGGTEASTTQMEEGERESEVEIEWEVERERERDREQKRERSPRLDFIP
ncbi:von Willebrand factor C domain-containing protein 2-like [Clupea harengus]|uniref:von Willebrand factor C domain-containing protein 2-like n=1 Tax=Clupea harengus TaxID=7950 RepID=A0A6P8F705_CLUHA|nr:von Willebrand factor C domain-containing protein 2-like [Clupea harengus]